MKQVNSALPNTELKFIFFFCQVFAHCRFAFLVCSVSLSLILLLFLVEINQLVFFFIFVHDYTNKNTQTHFV